VFCKLSDISVERQPEWSQSIYLTIDIDWAADAVLLDAVELLEKSGAQATWFVTHETKLLARLRENPNFELGIHPNFNFLLQGDSRNGKNAEEVVDRLMAMVPDAKSVRSHSGTQSSRILDLFSSRGLTHESNVFVPSQSGIELRPWRMWSGLTRVPYFWADDVACLTSSDDAMPMSDLVSSAGIKVFDFHPIHIFLNTEKLQRYEMTRALHRSPTELLAHRFEGDGARSRLIQCLNLGK
jgi:hypothetical protein